MSAKQLQQGKKNPYTLTKYNLKIVSILHSNQKRKDFNRYLRANQIPNFINLKAAMKFKSIHGKLIFQI